MGRVVSFGATARKSILVGMSELAKAVVSTLGPKGRLCILDNGSIHPVATKDGVSVSRFIEFSDPYKNIGAHMIQEVARRVESETGDGTTTSTLIAWELCKAGNSLINQGFDAVDIKKGFDKACRDVIDMLEKQKRLLNGEDDIFHIATISANNDEEIGGYIKEAYVNLGEGGRVNAVPSHNRKGTTSISYSNGYEINKGFFSSAMVNTDSDTCYFENPLYFFYDDIIDDIKDIEPIFTISASFKKSVVIVCLGMHDKFESSIIQALEDKRISAAVIKVDGLSKDSQDDNLNDLAVHTGAVIYGGSHGVSIDSFSKDGFGSSESITITKDKTLITGGAGKDTDVDEYVSKLRDKINLGNSESEEDSLSTYEIELIKERIAKLSGGIATIHYGGLTDIELKEKKDRYEDALKAVSTAIDSGIMAGGGCGLLHAVRAVNTNHTSLLNTVQETGYQEFLKIMEQPARYIIQSTGKDPGYYVEMIKENNDVNYGYNAKTETISKDMYMDGIVDPVMVIESALAYSTSMTGAFITTNCVITNEIGNSTVVANDKIVDERGDFDGNEE